MSNHAIYEGMVRHHRFKPVKHKLSYRMFSFLIDIDEIDSLDEISRFFSRNRFNLFSFYDRDHSADRSMTLSTWIRAQLEEASLPSDGAIQLLFYPRMLGYAFNPLSVYYCHDRSGKLVAILYAVRNTFGGRHAYLIPVDGGTDKIDQQTDKLFHVSPFIDMDMRYHFSLKLPAEDIAVSIRVDDEEGALMNANFAGTRAEITDKALLRLFIRYPLMTFKVIVGIHWEALRLVLKGLRLRSGSPDPEHLVTLVR